MTVQRLEQVFREKQHLLNIYYTAGFPQLNDTMRIAKSLEKAGVDMLEIGMPFSDPVADGPVIQNSSQTALKNGMTIKRLFTQLQKLREEISIPVLLMGYLNPIMQYGIENFCQQCAEVGIDGLIIPDLPLREYLDNYQTYFQDNHLANIFLIDPNTSEERIRMIDTHAQGFIYAVSSSSITGAKDNIQQGQNAYFQRIQAMQLNNPLLIGFGISNRHTFENACRYAHGAIIGSAFVQQLHKDGSDAMIHAFVKRIIA